MAEARWQIDILAADKTAAAFGTVDRRLKGLLAGQTQLNGAMGGFSSAASSLGRTLGNLAAGYLSIEGARKLFEIGLKAGDLGEQAEQIGLNTDELQAYRLAAVQAGISNEQLDAAFMRLAKAMGAANEGNDEMIARFDRLGVKLLDSHGELRKVGDVLPELSRALLNVGSESERSALLMELMGRSGSRMATLLRDAAGGSAALVASAKSQGAVISGEVSDAWDKLGDRMAVSHQKFETMVATFGRPIATLAFDMMNAELGKFTFLLNAADKGWSLLTGKVSGSIQGNLQKQIDALNDDITAFITRGYANSDPALQELIKRRDALQAELDRNPITMPAITVTGDSGGAGQPTGKAASAAGEKLDERLRALQAEHAALDKALAEFDVKGTETVDEVDKRISAQIEATRKIAAATKDATPGTTIFEQLKAEAQAVVDGNVALEKRKQLLTEAQQTTQTYGDGTVALARAMAELDRQLAAGAITQGTYDRAAKAATQTADDQARAFRGAAGGADAFIAGIEQAMADQARANSAFEAGRQAMAQLDEVIDSLAGTSRKSFEQIATDFGLMLLKMELRAQASNLFNSITGKGPTNQGLLSGLFGWLSGGSGSVPGIGSGTGETYADGGIVNRRTTFAMANGAGVMSERGHAEAIVPLRRGGNGRLGVDASGLGGGVVVNVYNTADGTKATTRESQGPGGQIQVDVLVETLEGRMAGRAARGQGPFVKTLEGRYGLAAVGR